jgi:hypothetical protein
MVGPRVKRDQPDQRSPDQERDERVEEVDRRDGEEDQDDDHDPEVHRAASGAPELRASLCGLIVDRPDRQRGPELGV